jgi:hypothetical protein
VRNALRLMLAAALSLVAVPSAHAQEERTATPADHLQVISASPILWMAKWFNADYERRITSTVTWGVSGSYLPVGDFDYGRASVLVRFYPQRAALTGFYLGGQSGVYRIADATEHEIVYGAGMDIGYAWQLGPKRNVAVSLGFGMSRLFGGGLDASVVVPNARLANVGIAF